MLSVDHYMWYIMQNNFRYTILQDIDGCTRKIRSLEMYHVRSIDFRKYGDPISVKRNKNGMGCITVYGYHRILKMVKEN